MYKGLVSNGYIIGFVKVPDGVFTEEQVQEILAGKPNDGSYRLKEDYTWEKYAVEEGDNPND